MISKVLILMILIITHTEVSWSETTKTETDEYECAKLQMGGGGPLAVWKMKNGTELVVCNFNKYEVLSDTFIRGWVNLFPRPVKLNTRLIAEVNSELPSEFITYAIKKESDTKVEVRKDIRSPLTKGLDSYDTPASVSYIDCSKKKCTRSKEKCIYEKPKGKPDLKIVDYVQRIADGKTKNLDEHGHYDVVIGKLVDAALLGNKRARKLILEYDRSKLQVDGASGETLNDGYAVVKGLVDLGCLK